MRKRKGGSVGREGGHPGRSDGHEKERREGKGKEETLIDTASKGLSDKGLRRMPRTGRGFFVPLLVPALLPARCFNRPPSTLLPAPPR
jgi:hypothetical protein